MSQIKRSLRIALVLAAGATSVFSETPAAPAATATAAAAPGNAFAASIPSGGRHEILLPIARWGRYSIRCTGDQPVALSVADRRSGVIARDGEAGQRNPRLDLFLDLGEYKLTAQGTRNAKGTSQVAVTPFTLPAGFKPAYLIPLRENRLSLDDLEQAVFWFEIPADTTVYIEAAGRNLADLVLWRDGEWLVRTDNQTFIAKPKDETPLSGISFAARLPKGMYMIGAYGGKGRSWSLKSAEHPFFIQYGLEALPSSGTRSLTIPPKGYVQVLLNPSTVSIVLEGPDKKRLVAEVNRLTSGFTPGGWLATDSIHAKLAAPRIRLQPQGVAQGNGFRTLKVTGSPGQPFILQTLGASNTYLSGSKGETWWVSSLHTGNPKDQISASGLVVETGKGAIVALQADTLSSDRELARRFNLLSDVNTFVWVQGDNKYSVTPGGTDFNWRVRRYFHTLPPNYKEPEWTSGAKTVELSQGLYILEMNPRNKGIATVILKKSTLLGGVISAGKAALGATGENRAWNAPNPMVRFSRLAPGHLENYEVILNSQSPEMATVLSRTLPIDPEEPLGFWQQGGEKPEIPIRLSGRRLVTLVDARGASVPFELNGVRHDKGVEADAGNHRVVLPPGGPEPRFVVLKGEVPERLPSASAPVFPDERRNAIPRFPQLATGKTIYLDLDRQGNQPYAVQVGEPGLYRIETTGRLGTELSLNDRFLHFTRSARMNGVGRNALLIEYLLPGQYQVVVGANGMSAGRLGLAVYRNTLVEGGALEPNIDNRKFIESFSGAGYDIRIPTAGRYRLESIGQNGNHSLRLEDKGGWPFEPAVSDQPLQLTLEKGNYRLISLPTAQEGRRISRLVPVVEKRSIKGKGPHPLPINSTLASTWVENAKKDTSGSPALFTFSLPAPISAKLTVTDGFKAALYRVDKGGEGGKTDRAEKTDLTGPAGLKGGAQGDSLLLSWSGGKKAKLAMGSYRIAVRPEKKRNHAPYQISVTTRDLFPGLSYSLNRKETLALSLGVASIVEIGSQGMLDVTATLLDSDGKTVLASNDDGYLDWNFSISRALKAGRYFLRTESAEKDFSSTTVFMRALTDTLMDTLSLAGGAPKSTQCNLNRRLGVFPLDPRHAGDILAVSAQGKSRIGCSLEKSASGAEPWIAVAQDGGLTPSLSIPRSPGGAYRLRVWSESNVDERISLTYAAATAKAVTWKDAESGLTGQAERLGADHRAWFKIDLGAHAPGHFRAGSDQNPLSGIAASIALDSGFIPESAGWFGASGQYAWVELRFEQAGRFRVKLTPMALEHLAPLAMPLIGGRPRVFETRMLPGSLGLLSVETDGSHPLAGLSARSGSKSGQFKVRGVSVNQALWIGPGRAATVSLPADERRAVIWNSLPPTDGTQPTARLTWTELPLVDGGALHPGVSAWTPGKPSARVNHLAKGSPVRLRITLPPRSAAFIQRGDGSTVLECSFEEEPIVREFITDGGELYLLGLSDQAAFDIATFALGAEDRAGALADQSLAAGTPWQAKLAREGATLLPLAAKVDKPLGLHYRGSVRGADWIGADGMLRPDLENGQGVGPGGILRLDHGAGWAKLDLCEGQTQAAVMACKWGAALSPSGPAEISQSMLVKLHDRINWFAFTVADSARHVNFSAPLPLAALILRDGTPAHYQEAWEGFNWDLPLAPGRYVLGIRPMAGSSLEGGPLSVLFRNIESLGEKRPFTAYMGAGETRLLRFDVAKKGDFGVGLRMTRETAQARLYDARGYLVHQGKQQFMTLKPGRYYLWLRVPEDAEGTDVTANLFGQEPPPNEPPEKLVKWIIGGAEGERPQVETTQEADAETQRPDWERFLSSGFQEQASDNSDSESGEVDSGDPQPEDGEEGAEGEESPPQENNEEEGASEGEGSEGE